MSKISALTELAEAPASTDEFVIVDKSDTSMAATGTTKRIQSQYVTIADASTTVKGKVELATNAEAITGTDTVRAVTPASLKATLDAQGGDTAPANLLKNGNFINNSTNGYGSTPDDWTSSNANPVQGGVPALTKQNLIDILGVGTGDIEGLWNLNNAYTDLSDNGYTLTDSGSPVFSDEGLMTKALDLEASSSQYATNAAANCNITGSQTWIAYIKPESIGSYNIIGIRASGGGSAHGIYMQVATGKVSMFLTGLTTTTDALSDVQLQAGIWYMVVGVYDSANSKLKIWVNGVKKEYTASGSATSVVQNLSIGRWGAENASYYDGLIQNAGVLSVALTDNQVKKLFAATMYKGQKIRRATTNAYAYQQLPQDLVERLRGKTVALRADLYQEVASTAQISIHQTMADATTDETIISATDATTGSWLSKVSTGTLEADVVTVEIRIKHSTSDGNTWFRNVSLYEGSTLLPYDHSKEDWSRFPRLLKMDIPAIISGYQFEENRLMTWVPAFGGYSVNPTTSFAEFIIRGQSLYMQFEPSANGTSNATSNTISAPAIIRKTHLVQMLGSGADNGTGLGPIRLDTTAASQTLTFYKDVAGNVWTGSGAKTLRFAIILDID